MLRAPVSLLLPICTLAFAVLAALTVGAVPQPRPGLSVNLKQTTRQDILDRQYIKLNAPQRRASSAPYPACPNAIPDFEVAIYTDRINDHGSINHAYAATLDDCIQRCRARSDCGSGDYKDQWCWLTSVSRPGFHEGEGFSGFVMNTNCADYEPSAPKHAHCCDY